MNWNKKGVRVQEDCFSAGIISSCLLYLQQGLDLCMRSHNLSGLNWRVHAGFLWLPSYFSYCSGLLATHNTLLMSQTCGLTIV